MEWEKLCRQYVFLTEISKKNSRVRARTVCREDSTLIPMPIVKVRAHCSHQFLRILLFDAYSKLKTTTKLHTLNIFFLSHTGFLFVFFFSLLLLIVICVCMLLLCSRITCIWSIERTTCAKEKIQTHKHTRPKAMRSNRYTNTSPLYPVWLECVLCWRREENRKAKHASIACYVLLLLVLLASTVASRVWANFSWIVVNERESEIFFSI